MDFRRSLFVRGLTRDSIPTVDSLKEYFTCKYMYFVYFFVSMLRLERGRGWRLGIAADLSLIYLTIVVVI